MRVRTTSTTCSVESNELRSKKKLSSMAPLQFTEQESAHQEESQRPCSAASGDDVNSNCLAPRGSTLRLITLYSALCTATNFSEGYSNTYPNTSHRSFHDFINGTFVERNGADGLSEGAFAWLWSLTLNIWFVGYTVGNLITPILNDRLGRRMALIVSNTVALLGALLALLSVLVSLPELFIVSRAIASTSAGVSFGTLVLFTQETAPTSLRGVSSFLSESTFIYTAAIGMAFGMDAIFGLILPALTGITILPCALAILLTLPLHETPKHLLITCGNRAAALRSLQYYRGVSDKHELELDEMLLEAAQSGDASRLSVTSRSGDASSDASRSSEASRSLLRDAWEALKTPHLRRAFLLGCACLQIVLCIWPLFYLSTDLLESNFSSEVAQLASLGYIIANCLASLAGCFIVERFGRRPQMLLLGAIHTAGLCAFIAAELLIPLWPVARYGQIASLLVMGVAYGVGLGPVSLFITSELVPQHARALVQSMVLALNTAMAAALSFVTLPLYRWAGVLVFVPLFVLPSVVALLFLFRSLPESAGREIHEVVEEIKRQCGERERPSGCDSASSN